MKNVSKDLHGIDEALVRRFRHMVALAKPASRKRERIWESLSPPSSRWLLTLIAGLAVVGAIVLLVRCCRQSDQSELIEASESAEQKLPVSEAQ